MAQDRVLVTPLGLIVLVTLAAAGAALFMSTRSAYAEISGPCIATISGVDVAGVDSGNRNDDIHVSKDQSVTVGAASAVGFQSHKIQLEFGSQRWTVSEEDDNGSPSWTGTVNVDDYATWGVGLYKVIGVSTLSDGTTCTGAATVDVAGNPLTTVAGGIAAGAAVLGTVGALATATVAATRSPLGDYDDVWRGLDRIEQNREQREQARSEQARREQAQSEQEVTQPISDIHHDVIADAETEEGRLSEGAARVLTQTDLFRTVLGCWCMAAIALVMMPLMVLTGGGAGGESGGPAEPSQPPTSSAAEPRRLPRAPWRPRITFVGLISGLLAGAGVVVLLQQYSIQYPTLGAIITWVVIGMVAYGVVLPTLARTISWLRINGRISRMERETGRK